MKKHFFCLLAIAIFSAANAGESYNFLMLSDTHFGPAATFGASPAPKVAKKLNRSDLAFPHYLAMFADMAKKSDANTKFLIHAGDMIEGWAHSPGAQFEQFQLLDTTLKKYFKIPLYMVRGNHEAAGKTGKEGYFQAIAPAIAVNAGFAPETIHYTKKYGDDIFIFVDCYDSGATDFVRKTLNSLPLNHRYIFLIIHNDQLPQVYEQANEMRKLLLPHNVIILNGHTHRTRVLKYERDGKTLTQFSIGSFLMPKLIRYGKVNDNRGEYLKNFRTSKYITSEKMLQIFDAEVAPFITMYKEYGGIKGTPAGYARIHVSDAGVTVTVQSGHPADKDFDIQLVTK